MRVYRFQNTKEIETNSYAEDILNIYLSYKGDEDVELTEELVDEIYTEWKSFIDLRLSTPDFSDLSIYEWVEKILSFETEEDAYEFQMKNKLAGVFAIQPTETLGEAFQLSVSPEMGIGNKYLIEAEADILIDLGIFGLLVEIEDVKAVHNTPSSYVEQKEKNLC